MRSSRPQRYLGTLGLLVVASVSLVPTASVSAEEIETTSDQIIFGKEEALWSMPAKGGEQSLLMALPWAADKVTRLRAAADGSALLINAEGFTAWTSLSGEPALTFLPCSGASEISQDGNYVVCGTQNERFVAVYQTRPALEVRIISKPASNELFFGSGTESIVGTNSEGVVDLSNDEQLAKHQPNHSLLVTPDGQRALGAYQEDGIDIVYGFRLDGKAIKRVLMHAARSIATSADSGWAAIQQDVDACAVRIVGGQYMCWRRVKALDISSAGHSLLVARTNDAGSFDLLLGAVRGTSSVKPTPLVEGVAGVAIFWPLAR